MQGKAVSIVVPVYNSQDTLLELYERVAKVMRERTTPFEFVFVDDFSQDDSWEVLKKIKHAAPEPIKLIRLAKNFGQHNATLCGFRHVSSEYVVTMDDDLQHCPEDLPLLFDKIESTGADVVYGISKVKQSAYRRLGSRIWKFGTNNFDEALGQGSSFRLISREIVDQLATRQHQHFVFVDEMLYWYTEYVEQVEVQFIPRPKGKSGYTPFKLFVLAINLAVFYSSVPLKLMSIGGILLSLVTFLMGVWFVFKKVAYGVPVPGFTSLIVTVLFSTSLILICLGVVGQYLGRIFTTLNNKPTYSIKEKSL
jgi:undecaprenyl-phosphate 4-deoxy-4-formamido-L-arabinose transferase